MHRHAHPHVGKHGSRGRALGASGISFALAFDVIREATRPADELAAAVRACDYRAVRGMMGFSHAGDAAALLMQLTLDDQVVVFRVLPRKNAAAVFEYLSQGAKERLLEGMAHEEVGTSGLV